MLRADHQIEYGKMSLTEEGEQALEICYDDLLDSIEALLSITFAILDDESPTEALSPTAASVLHVDDDQDRALRIRAVWAECNCSCSHRAAPAAMVLHSSVCPSISTGVHGAVLYRCQFHVFGGANCSSQNRAISVRVANHTSRQSWMRAKRRSSPRIRPGRPMTRGCNPTESMRGARALSR